MKRRPAFAGFLLVLSALLALASPVRAEAVRPKLPYGRAAPLLPLRLDAHLGLTWRGGFGLGGSADIPLVTSFRYAPRDELALRIGTFVAFAWFDGTRKVEGYPSLALQWSLSVTERFQFVPELGLAARIDGDGFDALIANVGFGARWYLRRSLGITTRLGWPVAISAGAVF
ncbi:MAG: hypothetical protein ABW252_16030 [Polyangiales bacterium]